MRTSDIWMQEKERRLDLFIERYLELDEMTGNRTLAEKDEMLEIATAITPTLIANHRNFQESLRANKGINNET